MRVLCLVACLLWVGACGTEEPAQLQGGTWGGDVGGSFVDLPVGALTANLQSAEFYHVKKYVGLGVTHEFIGVRITKDGGEKMHLTLGLIASDDASFFRDQAQGLRPFYRANTEEPLQAIKSTVGRYFAESWYNNPAVFVGGMVLTPVLGRPCAKVARQLVSIITTENMRR